MINFKKGMYELNDEKNFNFQLNRLINWDGGNLEEVKKVSSSIKTCKDWQNVLIDLGDKALNEERIEESIAYYRMSEFFMSDDNPNKLKYYSLAVDLFYKHYQKYFDDGIVERLSVPYKNINLPVLHVQSKGEKSGTILLHGGNDSYMEEFFFPILYLSENGYEVFLFEGPGQGSVLRIQKMRFTYKWEEPVSAILDAFNLNDVIIIGLSLGGMLAPRAAAFEKRIKKIIAWSVFPNFMSVALYHLPCVLKTFLILLLKLGCKHIINFIARQKMKKDPMMEWVFKHGMHAYSMPSPYHYLKNLNNFQLLDIADKITQDILILHGKTDHFIDWHLYKSEIDSLVNAHSVSLRLFTKEEKASDHCQCGDTKLALDTILCWLKSFKS